MHFNGRFPAAYCDLLVKESIAKLVGAHDTDEVAAMNGLSVNLHLLMIAFYQPSGSRYKILIEDHAFPSDRVKILLKLHGFSEEEGLLVVKPRPGEHNIRHEDIIEEIQKNGDEIALCLFSGVHYYTERASGSGDHTAGSFATRVPVIAELFFPAEESPRRVGEARSGDVNTRDTSEPSLRSSHRQNLDIPLEDRQIVIYNRVPKTGSTSFVGLAYDLCGKNKFNVLHINVTKNSHVLSPADQLRFVNNVTNWTEKLPALYHGHLSFLDFANLGASELPLYVNVIRKPLDRFISYYYFLRYGDDFRPHLVRKKQGDKMTFDQCVQKRKPECDTSNLWLQVPFFCGQSAECWIPGNEWALDEAKRNLVEKYFVVGLTEQMEEFIAVLEASLPRFFKGALTLYRKGSKSHLRKTNQKVPPSPETLLIIKKSNVWRIENEFYEFAARQFEAVKKRTLEMDKPEWTDRGQQFFYEKIRPK
nr:EOG090X088H [Eulimnadia texana]